ncbi:MAG: VOC family protein [Pseudomonadota bacterium]
MDQQQPQGVVPHLVIEGAADALDFYKTALGATELMRLPAEDGKRLLHAAMVVNGCHIYLMDDFVEHRERHGGNKLLGPKTNGATTFVLHLNVPDCDTAVKRAAEAGASVIMEPWDAFWGDRYGQVLDPFGHVWSFAHPLSKN